MMKRMKFDFFENVLFYIFLAVVSIVLALISLDFLNIRWDIYCSVSRDSAATEAIIKSIQENGIYGLFFNPRVGAPDIAASWLDASGIDLLLGLIIWLLNAIFNPSTQRLYYYTLIATFVLSSWGMSVLLNRLRVNRTVNFVFSLLFSFAPYHFYRYMYHIALGNAFTIPLAIVMCMYVLDICRGADQSKEKKWVYIFYGILLGLGCPYYVFFALILFAVTFIVIFINKNSIKACLGRSLCIVATLVALFISRVPNLILNMRCGKNNLAFARIAEEQEVYALKIIQMLLPVKYSRIKLFSDITEDYYSHFQFATENYMSSLGLVASVGFLILCGMFIFSFINRPKSDSNAFNWQLIDFMALSTLCLILVSDTGGFGEIFNKIVTPQFRCYNRVSVVITCLALMLVAYLFDFYFNKNKLLFTFVLFMCLSIGLYDQMNIADMKVERQTYEYWDSIYGDFFSRVEASVPEEALIYQLPYMDYPEVNAINNLERSKHFIGYLYTDNIRWSFGGIMGRDTKAQELNIDDGMSLSFLHSIIAAGFSGVYIDVDGYSDEGERILTFYNNLGIEPIISDDNKLFFYNISEMDLF